MKGLFLGNRVGVPMISFLDKIRTAVGETLGGAGTTGVPGIGREPRPFFGEFLINGLGAGSAWRQSCVGQVTQKTCPASSIVFSMARGAYVPNAAWTLSARARPRGRGYFVELPGILI